MVTLTVDPEIFPEGPSALYRYVRARRAIGELVKALRKAGFLNSRHYVAVLETHKSGWPHWHLVIDSDYVPFTLICRLWNRNRPLSAGPVQGSRPGFGSVRFSKMKFKNVASQAAYLTKYVIKLPEGGVPEWIKKGTDQVRKFNTSRGFWTDQKKRNPPKDRELKPHQGVCFCERCREYLQEEKQPRKVRTVEERLKRCGDDAIVMIVTALDSDNGEQVGTEYLFDFALHIPFREAAALVGWNVDGVHRYPISEKDASFLMSLTKTKRESAEQTDRRLFMSMPADNNRNRVQNHFAGVVEWKRQSVPERLLE